MLKPQRPSTPDTSPILESLRLAWAASLSLGISVAFFDLLAGILRDHPRAFQGVSGMLRPLSMSVPAFALICFAVLLGTFLASLPFPSAARGPLLFSTATALGIVLVLAEMYNLFPPRPTPAPSRTWFLSAFLALALGVWRYYSLSARWTEPAIPHEAASTLLALPVVFGIGLLGIWQRSYRLETLRGFGQIGWNLGIAAALALAIVGAAASSRRIRFERWLTAMALALVAPGAMMLLLEARPGGAIPHGSANRPLHHIIFLSIDTLRYDAVSALRREAPPTPSLDSLASDSVVFTRAYSPAPWTLPAFSSMMTGVTPLVHGMRKFEDRLPTVLPTLAEKMRGAGYTTVAFGDQLFLHPQQGISRGFDSYQLSPRDVYGASLGAKLLGKAFPARYKPILYTTEITDLTVDWLRHHASGDFFLWIHYFKPHGPYEPPPRYRPKGPPPAGMGFTFSSDNAIRSGSLVITAPQRPWVRELYEGEIRYVDDNVGQLLAELKSLGLYDGALIIFVSDHGEEFWDHDGRAHGHTFYDELLHVPLFVKLPGEARRERRDDLVCTGSIYPTLLSLAGIDPKGEGLSYASLTPLLGGAGEPYREVPVLSATPLYYEDRESIVSGDTKYIVSLITHREQLYDLKDDPKEQHDLAGTPSDRLTRARVDLDAATRSSASLRERLGIQNEAPTPLSPEVLEQLRSLGYVH